MIRKMMLAAAVGLGLATLGATAAFAAQPALKLNVPTNAPSVQLRPQGLQIIQVLPGSPAAQQGLEPGDVILGVNGNAVRSIQDLNYWLARSFGAAQLQVVDSRTGWTNSVMVYPVNGRIGIVGGTTPVNPVRPVVPIFPPIGSVPTPIGLGHGNG